jgi:hypothetical protein
MDKTLMSSAAPKQSREARMAEKLRENLRRRKHQAREQNAALPKVPPKS